MKLHEKEKINMQIATFDGIAFQLIEAWQKLDYRKSLEIINTIESIMKKAKKQIKEEIKNEMQK